MSIFIDFYRYFASDDNEQINEEIFNLNNLFEGIFATSFLNVPWNEFNDLSNILQKKPE